MEEKNTPSLQTAFRVAVQPGPSRARGARTHEAVSVVTHSVPGSIVHHLNPNCRHLKHARRANETRQPNLWPGFVCQACRVEAACGGCGAVWPYCACTEEAAS